MPNLIGGGAEAAVRTLCGELARSGVDVTLVSVYPSGLEPGEVAGLGVPLIDLGRQGRRDHSYFPKLVRTLRRSRPDVVHLHLHTGQYPGRVAAVLARAPAIVLTMHGDEPRSRVRWVADRVLHARTARFVVFTEAQRRRFAAEEGVPLERIAVIPNGVAAPAAIGSRDELRAVLGLPRDAFVLYTAGRLAPEKNQRVAIEALARLRAAGATDVHLAIAGDGALSGELHALASELGIGEYVHFLGFRRDAAALVRAMDLFVLPSLRERMPLALAEAMLAGVGVAIAPWTGYDDVVRDGETGFVATAFDADAFAAAVMRAYRDGDARAAAARRGEAAARTMFDAGAAAQAHVELYRELGAKARR
jgi:glycosyltransferase involved in cell wall biosynthesis